MSHNSFLLVFALCSLQLKVDANLFCYTETEHCRTGRVTILRQDSSAAAKQCCIGNGGVSYRVSNSEGCTNCVVYGFFANQYDGKLLSNASIGQGDQKRMTVYFGLLKGLLPSIRRVQFRTDASNQGSSKCTVTVPWPYLTSLQKISVTVSASSNNLALEGNNSVQINPQLSSTGENEFVVPLNVAILDTNVMTVNFSSGAYYYMSKESANVSVTIVRGTVSPAKPLKFSLNFFALDETLQVTDTSLGSTTVMFPTNKAIIDVPIDISRYNFTSDGLAVRLELDDKSQANSVNLNQRNLTYVYFNTSILVGFTVSEMNVTTGQSFEICVNVPYPLPGMEPITMTISSEDKKNIVTLSDSNPVSCIQWKDTPHAGLVVYRLSSEDTRQPLDIFPDTLTVTVDTTKLPK